ncbi:MAG: lytic transglycosylase domain-containing protein [Thermoanaerobaculia bacterium]
MWRPPARVIVVLVALLATSLPSAAELVVFSGGHVLKVAGFEVSGDAVELRLASGGGMRVSLASVERIVDDEIESPAEQPESVAPISKIRIDFDEQDQVPGTPFGEVIFAVARREKLNPELVAAMVRHESAFDPGAVSVKGARGLMQLMPATARRFGVPAGDLFNPARNLEAGTRYLRWLAGRYPDDLPRILAAYNAGEANVERYDGVPPFRETRGYLRRIYGTLGSDEDPVAAR